MKVCWGYSPKIEKYIPLGDFPSDKYLIIVCQVLENLGWKLSHLSETGLIAYTGISLQSYSEEISVRILSNFAVVKSECIGVQMLFNDYGKNNQNLDKFFHEFEYVEYHLEDVWEERLNNFHQYIQTQDDTYFEHAPLTAKNKIKNVFFLFWPQRNYAVTPVIIGLNILYWMIALIFIGVYFNLMKSGMAPDKLPENILLFMGANNRTLVLDGQVWRLITASFFHVSFFHLFFNMYALVYIGLMIENKFGWRKTLTIYLLSGICASLTSVVFHDARGVMIGASGAIMGMFGAFLALLMRGTFEKNATRALLISTVLVVAIMLFNGLTSKRVDNAAHFGGLIAGFIIGNILYHEEVKWRAVYIRYALPVLLTLGFGLAVLFLTPNYQNREFFILRKQFMENSVPFNRIYSINNEMSRQEKLEEVKTSGLEVWKKNLEVVREMEKLALDEEGKIYCKFSRKIAVAGYNASKLMYADYDRDSRDNHNEIVRLLNSIYGMQEELRMEIEKKDYQINFMTGFFG